MHACTTFWHPMQVQVANTQWILIVELHQFHNLYNAEIRSNAFCCCDLNKPCQSHASNLQGCDGYCDTQFSAYVSHCIQPYQCILFSSTFENTASIINLNYTFIFVLNSLPDMVSVKNSVRITNLNIVLS